MKIKINGKDETINKTVNIVEFVSARGLVPDHVVIEHNHRIVPREEWPKVVLNEDDALEIVSFVGGG